MKIQVFIFLIFVNLVFSAPTFEDWDLLRVKEDNLTAYYANAHGYQIDEHFVTTPDGYILRMFRIPNPGKEVVFVQHGLLCSSTDWLVLGPGKSLPYLLFEAGYDVWLGNQRGNTNSKRHQYLSPSKKEFWDFSWHEIGQFDLPAMIDYALLKSGKKQLHYIGHSQGTTAFFVMGSLRKEMNAKIKTMHALAPVAFMSNLASPFVRFLAPFVDQIEWVVKMLGVHEFLPSNEMMVKGGQTLCDENSRFREICANVLFLLSGYNSPQLDRSIIPNILLQTPAGASVNQLVHYAQLVNSGKFRMLDHGIFKNLATYGRTKPPAYDLSAVSAPVFLHYSGNDWLSAVKDVDQLASLLPNVQAKLRVPDPKFNHLDYMWATDANSLLYQRIISLIDRY